jgi:hypothetical protein
MSSQDPLQDSVDGYPRLAAQIGLRPELAIFRRFGFLNAQNLLYYQAELSQLEKQLRQCQREDSMSRKDQKARYALNWYWLRESVYDEDTRQLDVVIQIRKTLRLYSRI